MDARSLLSFMKKLSNQAKNRGGMSDDIPAVIDGTTPAAISSGEYIVPADVVSLIGDGDTEAGAKILDDLMQEIRQKKTGTKKQPQKLSEVPPG